jgi:hypothetical protein
MGPASSERPTPMGISGTDKTGRRPKAVDRPSFLLPYAASAAARRSTTTGIPSEGASVTDRRTTRTW